MMPSALTLAERTYVYPNGGIVNLNSDEIKKWFLTSTDLQCPMNARGLFVDNKGVTSFSMTQIVYQ